MPLTVVLTVSASAAGLSVRLQMCRYAQRYGDRMHACTCMATHRSSGGAREGRGGTAGMPVRGRRVVCWPVYYQATCRFSIVWNRGLWYLSTTRGTVSHHSITVESVGDHNLPITYRSLAA